MRLISDPEWNRSSWNLRFPGRNVGTRVKNWKPHIQGFWCEDDVWRADTCNCSPWLSCLHVINCFRHLIRTSGSHDDVFSFKPSRSEERTDEGENRCSATRDLPAVPTGVRVITHVASLPRLVTGEHQHSDLEVRSLKCSASTVGLPSGALKALNKDAENGKKKSRSQTPPDLCCIKATTVLVQQLLQVFQTPLGCEVKPRLTSPPEHNDLRSRGD